ncbi:hypothetical protein EE612_022530 [Oryza sativa]|nr:hypothetical protein EE612_022530 [Oryza sativa]
MAPVRGGRALQRSSCSHGFRPPVVAHPRLPAPQAPCRR